MPAMVHLLALIPLTVFSRIVQSCWTSSGNALSAESTLQRKESSVKTMNGEEVNNLVLPLEIFPAYTITCK